MKRETSCINSRVILNYLEAHYDGDLSPFLKGLDPEIDAFDDPLEFLRDPNNWISCTVISKLYERTRTLLKDENAAYKIARYAAENAELGYAQGIIVKAFWSIKKGLKSLQKINDKWNISKRIELVEIKRNRAIIRLHWDPQMDVSKDICLYNQGAYTFMPLIWGGNPITLIEKACYFEGAPFCEYHIRWPIRNLLHEILSRFYTSKSVLMETIDEMEKDKKVIEQKYEEVNRLNEDLNYKIKQLLAIQETGKAIISVLDLDKVLTVIMNILSNVCSINRAMIMLVNKEAGCLQYIHGVGFKGDVPEVIKEYEVPLDRVSNILARVASTGRPEYISHVERSSLRRENIVLAHGKPSSVYVVPLITRSKVIGVIATDAISSDGLPEETRETLEVFGPQIAIAIENARLYSTLQEQMHELKRSHALLSRAEKFSFLGNLSARLAHEIKNPLTSIRTFIQMLPQKFDDEEFRTDFYGIAMEETDRVNNLITELLELVKTNKPLYKFSDIHEVIDKMILLVSPQSKGKRISVVSNFDPDIALIWIDPEKIKQVILNLLSNALDFTPEGGQIKIITKKSMDKDGNNCINIEVRDNGTGISEEMIEKVFDPYFTTKHKSTIHNGTGLGLFIVHQNVQDHGGTIDIKSQVDQGASFFITLPCEPPSGLPEKQDEG